MRQLWRSKIFLRQFCSFSGLICMTVCLIGVSLWQITRITLEKQQLYIVESYRKEVAQIIRRWTEDREAGLKIQAMYLGALGERRLASLEVAAFLRRELAWNDNFYNIAIFDRQGHMINSDAGQLPIRVADRPYFLKTLQGAGTTSGFFKSRIDGAPIMAITEPIVTGGKVRYVFACFVSLEKYRRIVAQLNLGQLGQAYLVDRHGALLTDSRLISDVLANRRGLEKGQSRLSSPAVRNVIRRRAGGGIYRDYRGERVFGSYEWLEPIQAGLLVEFSEGAIMQPLHSSLKLLGVLAVVVVLLGAGLAFLLSWRVVHPIQQLIAFAANITGQRYQGPLRLTTGDELDELIGGFNAMQEAICAREAELHQQNYVLEDLATKDGLTGLYNHALLSERFEREYQEHRQTQRPLSFVMLDIDHFKVVNDTFGHLAGDQVLRQLAAIIVANVRQSDLVGRYGGEEFGLILPDTDAETAYRIGERIRLSVAQASFLPDLAPGKITVSLGICARRPLDPSGGAAMIQEADEALYRAKRNGRNRVEVGRVA